MKKVLLGLLLATLSSLAFAAVPTIVGTPVTVGNATSGNTTSGGSGSYTITASGDDLLIDLTAVRYSGTYSLSSITTSSGTITTDKAFAAALGGGLYFGTGAFRVHGATAASYTITITWSVSINAWAMALSQGHGIAGVDGTPPASTAGSSTAPLTGSQSVVANDLVVAFIADGTGGSGDTLTWTSPFTQFAHGAFTSTGMDIYAAQDAPSAGSISAGGTLGTSGTWTAQLIAYTGSAGGSCTDYGRLASGGFAIPNATSGSYILANGSIGTPDCSTVKYCNRAGSCSVN